VDDLFRTAKALMRRRSIYHSSDAAIRAYLIRARWQTTYESVIIPWSTSVLGAIPGSHSKPRRTFKVLR
jgi:hypothetical protein